MNWIRENLYRVKEQPDRHTLTVVCDKKDLKREKIYWKFWGFSVIKKEVIDDELLLLFIQKIGNKKN